jgi:aspartate-semialdehyde dehydrogenase
MKTSNKKLKVGVLGATGMVGQRFISLLENHPWFNVVVLAASPQSAGKKYSEVMNGRWAMSAPIPKKIKNIVIKAVEEDFDKIVKEVDLVFSAIDMDKQKIKEVEEKYAAAGVAVVSNNSAHRWTEDVPMIMPELNEDHLKIIDIQRKNRGWKKGLLVVKPNCSRQSYLPVIYALKKFGPEVVSVTTLQAISGAGKTFETWPEMVDNCIPFIGGEEEKTEKEPLKILGSIKGRKIVPDKNLNISATCIRVACSNGHMASVAVKFKKKPTKEQIIDVIENFKNPLTGMGLPSAPKQFIKYFSEDNRPQTKLDRDHEKGMGITCGRFREDSALDWKFIALSHNTIRGAAGGAILIAELLYKKGYIK